MAKTGKQWIDADLVAALERELRSLADVCVSLEKRMRVANRKAFVEGLSGTNEFKGRAASFLRKIQTVLETSEPLRPAEPPQVSLVAEPTKSFPIKATGSSRKKSPKKAKRKPAQE